MKQKYIIKKDDDKNTLVLKEYAELDKEIMSFMNEQEYNQEDITQAITGGSDELISVLRNTDFYPPQVFAEKLAEKITEIFDTDTDDAVELLLNDADFLIKDAPKEPPIIPELEGGDDDVDDLLEDDLADSNKIGKKSTPIKIADDETLGSDIEIDSKD